jgi:hypothetical protein
MNASQAPDEQLGPPGLHNTDTYYVKVGPVQIKNLSGVDDSGSPHLFLSRHLSLPGCDTMANAAAGNRFHLGPARKCCVTGGTRGIGRAIVDEFVSLGAQVSGLQ